MDIVENEGDKGDIGLDNMDSMENEGDVDNSMGSVLGLAREDLSCTEIEISDSSILKETATARLDAESLSNRSPTSGENGKVWELGGVWNWIINKKSRGSKLNFPNELVE
ncbi:hypothetical protein F2Q69_00047325 [Brassica cretica]|uniref:Uncharacterized protein n=1 Tax=Brassica cretica TaxID=69181 RepID=A0A8S9PT64_BRACR|nr:hypothetical protein F2Q69_00047325 [Brassica cretica]